MHRPRARVFWPFGRTGGSESSPRAAIFENGMGDADELLFVTKGDDAMPVLKPDRARGLEARCGEAHELIEEDAAGRVASAFRHELKAMLVRYLFGIMIPNASAHRYLQGCGEFPVIRWPRRNAKVAPRAEVRQQLCEPGDSGAVNLDLIEALSSRMSSPFRSARRGKLNSIQRLEPAAPMQKA